MGELIDRSVTFWRAQLLPLFKLCLGFELVLYALTKVAILAAQRWAPFLTSAPALNAAAADPNNLPEMARQLAVGGVGMTALTLVVLWVHWWVAVAATHYCVDQRLGRATTLGESVSRAVSRIGAVTAAYAISLLWGVVAGVVCALPGLALLVAGAFLASSQRVLGGVGIAGGAVLLFLGELLAVLWYLLRFLLTAQVLSAEGLSARAALRRSKELMSGRIGLGLLDWVKVRATLLLTVLLVIRVTVGLVGSLPQMIVSFVYGHAFDAAKQDLSAIPQALLVPAELLNVLAQSAFGPLYFVFCALFYLDLRVRREGLDLELQLAGANARAA